MNAEFQWWLLILGIVIGGALVYLVLAELRSDDDDSDVTFGPSEDPIADPDTTDPDPPEPNA